MARRLRDVADHRLGVAAFEAVRSSRSSARTGSTSGARRSRTSPSGPHVAPEPDMARRLYGAASEVWREQLRPVHTVTLWARDADGEAAWHDLGFGRVVVDTVRDLTPPRAPEGVDVRRAGASEAAGLARRRRSFADRVPLVRADRAETLALAGSDVIRCDGPFRRAGGPAARDRCGALRGRSGVGRGGRVREVRGRLRVGEPRRQPVLAFDGMRVGAARGRPAARGRGDRLSARP